MTLKKLNKQDGFTIIEVLIVLAIAGLIMLVVFLAVPALQRNSRNTQRTNDASLVGNSLNECLANKNGQRTSCDSLAELTALGLDVGALQQLTTVGVTAAAPTIPAAGALNTINMGYNARCTPAGDAIVAGSNREAVVVYRIEVQGNTNGTPRCIEI